MDNMHNLSFWVYAAELDFADFKLKLAELLGVSQFQHDTENYWEYMEGFSKTYKARINVSRPHKHRMDLPENEIPLHLIFYASNIGMVDRIGYDLNQFFTLPVHYGRFSEKSTENGPRIAFKSQKIFNRLDFAGLLKNKR